MASDGDGVFVATGNNLAGVTTHADSEEIVRVTGLGTVDRSTNANVFYPASWQTMDGADADMTSSSPVYFSSPSPMVAAVSKDGHFYLLDAKNLGGMGGELADLVVASGGGAMLIHTALATYTTGTGRHVVFTTNSNAICPAGGASGKVVMSVLVPAGSPPKPTVAWCVPTSSAALGFPAAPAHHHDRRDQQRDRLGHQRHDADGRRRRHGRDPVRGDRQLHGCPQVDRAHRGQGADRRRGRHAPLRLVAALRRWRRHQPRYGEHRSGSLPHPRSSSQYFQSFFAVIAVTCIFFVRRAQ